MDTEKGKRKLRAIYAAVVSTAFFLGVAFLVVAFFVVAFFAAGLAGGAVVFVTRPDLVLLRIVGFSVTAGAWMQN